MADGGLINPNLGWQQDPITGEWKQVALNSQVNAGSDSILGLSGNQWGALTNVGGLAMKAIALPGQMDYFKAQTGLAEQQLKSNQQAMADRKTFNQNWANASNSLTGKL